MSNAKMWTLIVMSSTLTSLRLRFVISWNGSSFLVVLSQATASQSRTNDLAPSLIACRSGRRAAASESAAGLDRSRTMADEPAAAARPGPDTWRSYSPSCASRR
jgi:hypothetical protein